MKVLNGQSWRVGCHATEPIVGKVVIVRSQVDLAQVNKGDILVAQQTDVNYTPQMLGAAAVITEDGGRYSHAATFTRENNIPCLIGAVGIMNDLISGDIISVDTRNKSIFIMTNSTEKKEVSLK